MDNGAMDNGAMMQSNVTVITGSTRGIGYGLAESFLKKGCAVFISGRKQEGVDRAVTSLNNKFDAYLIAGKTCDVLQFNQVQALWDAAVSRFGSVDIWINNAGLGQSQRVLWELDTNLIESLTDTNIKGALFGCKVAAAGMLKQGKGAIYNMEGFGSDGMKLKGMTLYGMSKRALAYITDSLALELKGTKVIAGGLRPGMTATELITKEYTGKPDEWKKVEKIFNILSDKVETVTPWLVDKMLANNRNGRRFVWLTSAKAALRFMAAPVARRRIFGDLNHH